MATASQSTTSDRSAATGQRRRRARLVLKLTHIFIFSREFLKAPLADDSDDVMKGP